MSKTLLLADDSVTIQKVVGISFASEDIAISTVDNGDDAISKARELRPDVILADVVMPGKSGYEVCEAVKADASLAHIPVLLLTGTFEAFDEDRAAAAGASGHVAKPFEAQTLVERVKELLAQSPPPAAPAPEPTPEPASTIVQEMPVMPAAAAASPDNSFDFFDDQAEPAVASAPLAADSTAAGASLDFDGPDAAFAFGDDDLSTTDPDDMTGPNDPRAASIPPPEATVAILPEDLPPADLTPPAAPSAGDDFDFAFETVKPKPGADPIISGEALAQAAVLDPDAGADFDVSSSDLGSSVPPGPPPTPEMASHDVIPPPVPQEPDSTDSVVPAFAAEPVSDPVMDLLSNSAAPATPEPISEPEAFAPSPGDTLDAAPAAEAAWDPIASLEGEGPEPVATAEPIDADPMDDEPMEITPIGDALSEPATDEGRWESAREVDIQPEPAPAMPVTPATAPPVTASDLIERIEPALRGQIHETLEKIAWESFGQATESIVAKAIERMEQVAWEVVPKLAETLIQEEIRKLKGDSEDL